TLLIILSALIVLLPAAAARIGRLLRLWLRVRLEEREEAVGAPFVAGHDSGRGLSGDEAALRLVAQHRNELGAVVGFLAQRLVGDDDRGSRQGTGRDAIEHLLRDGDAVERVLRVVGTVDRDRGPAQPGIVARHRGEDVRTDLPAGIADRDRNLDRGIEY